MVRNYTDPVAYKRNFVNETSERKVFEREDSDISRRYACNITYFIQMTARNNMHFSISYIFCMKIGEKAFHLYSAPQICRSIFLWFLSLINRPIFLSGNLSINFENKFFSDKGNDLLGFF